jgi:CheY-like chemotaxis protein
MDTSAPHPPLTILVVEDNPADVYILRRVLNAHAFPYDLQVIENGERALQFFHELAQQEHPQCPELLLLDLNLPAVNGNELLQAIKRIPECADIRIIMITASDDPRARLEAQRLGADAFFQKPFGFEAYLQLGDLIKAVVFGNAHEG